jgi:phosphatidylethanolamine-binding protein (PEBP) family uncharacterized protein
MRSKLTPAIVLTLALGVGSLACSSNEGGGGTGGSSSTGGRGGSGGSSSTGGRGGSTGGSSSTGGTTGGSSSTGGSGGSAGTGGSTGGTSGSGGSAGTGGSTGGTGGSTGGTGGSAGTGGSGGSTGGTGGSSTDGAAADKAGDGAGGTADMGGQTGALMFNALGLNPTGTKGYMAPSFPRAMSNGGGNHSPAMEWTGEAPAGTKSWAITLIDTNKTVQAGQPVVPNTFVKVHFSYYDIPLATRSLKADLPRTANIPDPAGMKASATFNGGRGWFGPGAGPPPHIYILSLWALNVDALPGGGSQQGTYDAIVKAAIGQPIKLVVVGTNDGI